MLDTVVLCRYFTPKTNYVFMEPLFMEQVSSLNICICIVAYSTYYKATVSSVSYIYLFPHSGIVFPVLQKILLHTTVVPLSRNIQMTVPSLESYIERWTTLHWNTTLQSIIKNIRISLTISKRTITRQSIIPQRVNRKWTKIEWAYKKNFRTHLRWMAVEFWEGTSFIITAERNGEYRHVSLYHIT